MLDQNGVLGKVAAAAIALRESQDAVKAEFARKKYGASIFGQHDNKTLAQLADVAGGGLDEAPQAYRRLPEVLAAQGDTIKVLHTLTPLIVVMAGENEYDPYKD